MHNRAYLESDSMMPEPFVAKPAAGLEVPLQLSINARLMERCAALEQRVKALEEMRRSA